MSQLTVKIFLDGASEPSVMPVATKAEARTLFNRWANDDVCSGVYVYRDGTIIASWDRNTEYLMAIGDIALDEDGCYDGDPYGAQMLYGDDEPEVQP